MCLILHKPAKVEVPEDDLEAAFDNNSDGMGVMFTQNGRVVIHRAMPKTFGKVMDIYNQYKTREIGVHFRTNTRGKTAKWNCHPFSVLEKKTDGADLFMMHNGTIHSIKCDNDGYSDTYHLSELLRPFIKQYGLSVIQDPLFQNMLSSYIGATSKLLLVDGEGNWAKINEDAGSSSAIDGCWVSNTYSLIPLYPSLSSQYKDEFDYGNYRDKSSTVQVKYPLVDDKGSILKKVDTMDFMSLTDLCEKRGFLFDPYSMTITQLRVAVTKAVKEEKKVDTPKKDYTIDSSMLDTVQDTKYGEHSLDDLMYTFDPHNVHRWVLESPEDATDLLLDLLRVVEEDIALTEKEDDNDTST